MRRRTLAVGLLPLLSAACVTTTTTSTTWGEPGPPERYGQVAWIRETTQQQQGHPVEGAAVGAVIGGLFGQAFTGSPAGTLFGALGGAAVGASASEGSLENRAYQVAVRFNDGEEQVFLFRNYCPFGVGDAVSWGPSGLRRRSAGLAAAPALPPVMPPPPPANTPAPAYAPPPAYTPPPPPPYISR